MVKETKLARKEVEKFIKPFKNWKAVEEQAKGDFGRLAILWDSTMVEFEITGISKNWIGGNVRCFVQGCNFS